MICPKCNNLNPKNVNKCVNCGAKLSSVKSKSSHTHSLYKNKRSISFKPSISFTEIRIKLKKWLKKLFLYGILIGGIILFYKMQGENIKNFLKTNEYTADIYANVTELTLSEEEIQIREQAKQDSIQQALLKEEFVKDSLNKVAKRKKLTKKKKYKGKDFNFYEVMSNKNKKQFVHKDTTLYVSKSDADEAQKYKKGNQLTDKFIYGKDQKKMMLVKSQTVTLGDKDGSHFEQPEHQIKVNAFYMDAYEVTNIEFKRFLHETQYKPKGRLVHLKDPRFNGDRQPVVDVAYEDAQAYATWAGKRLPTEAEWIAAAKQGKNSIFPTGEKIAQHQANYNKHIQVGSTRNVGSYKPNSYGIYDLAGNATEWTYGMLKKYPGNTTNHSYYNKVRLTKGGSWMSPEKDLKCTRRAIKHFYDSGVIGFRCIIRKK